MMNYFDSLGDSFNADLATITVADLNLSNDNETYRVGFGKTTSEIWSREGLFDGTYRKYIIKLKINFK